MARLALILSLVILFTAPAAFAFDGLSIGVGIGVATDIGDFKSNDINNIRQMQDNSLDHESEAVTPNIALYLRLDFANHYFLRLGVEYSKMVEGNEIEGHNTYDDINLSYDYSSTVVPFIFGINIPVRRGRYNIYAGMGPAFVKVDFEKEYEFTYFDPNIIAPSEKYVKGRVEGGIDGPGTAFLVGLSVSITHSIHFTIEFQKLYLRRYTTIEGYQDVKENGTSVPGEEVHDIMRLSAPDDTIRFGLVYDI